MIERLLVTKIVLSAAKFNGDNNTSLSVGYPPNPQDGSAGSSNPYRGYAFKKYVTLQWERVGLGVTPVLPGKCDN